MITVSRLTKRYGDVLAVDDVSFDVRPGRVTGFVGPNGAGKSTTMRMILGLDTPTAGTVTIDGRRYDELVAPLRTVGALLDAGAVDGGRTARNHLLWLARSNGIDRDRIPQLLRTVGLAGVADRRVATYSLGMRQRLGLAAALIGDPSVVLLDEPANGLDPDGISWLRSMMRDLAAEGRAVLVSSHLMSEVAQTASHLIVIGRGRIVADGPIDAVIAQHGMNTVVVRAERDDDLAQRLAQRGARVERDRTGAIVVSGLDATTIGAVAAAERIALSELSPRHASLEDAFLELTRDLTLSTDLTHAGDRS